MSAKGPRRAVGSPASTNHEGLRWSTCRATVQKHTVSSAMASCPFTVPTLPPCTHMAVKLYEYHGCKIRTGNLPAMLAPNRTSTSNHESVRIASIHVLHHSCSAPRSSKTCIPLDLYEASSGITNHFHMCTRVPCAIHMQAAGVRSAPAGRHIWRILYQVYLHDSHDQDTLAKL